MRRLTRACLRSPSGTRWLLRGASWIGTVIVVVVSCGHPPAGPEKAEQELAAKLPPSAGADRLVDATERAGITFVHANGMVGSHAIVETMGAGGALFDADGDGDLDLYLVQGGPLRTMPDPGTTHASGKDRSSNDRLLRNETPSSARVSGADPGAETNADLGPIEPRFVDVTAQAGQLGGGYGIGVAAGDVDRDGDIDLYVTNDGHNQLLRNHGDGTFADATAASGLADDARLSVPAVFFDLDRDGWLDLYVGNYVEVPPSPPRCRDTTGSIDYCGPDSFAATADRLLRNLGAGPNGWLGFEDITRSAGLARVAAPALGAVAADFDGNGWLDLYIANDGRANHLWMNQGPDHQPRFLDQAVLAGCAVNASGSAEASMGVEAADIDQDGDIDLFMTHLISETNTLYLNNGDGMFEDASTPSGLGAASRPFTAFGTGVFDLGNDGVLDLVVLNGAVNNIPALVGQGDPYPLHQPNLLFVGTPSGRFEDASNAVGPAFAHSEVSRGAIFGDVDNDGDTDLVVTNNHGPARLLLDATGQDRAWLGLRVLSSTPPRDALGARVAIEREGRGIRWQRVATDGSYASARDPRVRFGLLDDRRPQTVRVHWPNNSIERFADLTPGRYHTLVQGTGSEIVAKGRAD